MNPWNLDIDLRRHVSWPLHIFYNRMSCPPINGADTDVFSVSRLRLHGRVQVVGVSKAFRCSKLKRLLVIP
ncbi:uncharacterized protein BCR38DRAFT_426080 [Pseudomassariella vexata]|uniref:Uncharacterized protein n=1 Tax=Pseudomassariella vexata TaxID=1141098 RepID=A0A1Y2E6A4_9PEZI|nr:uncharacterized protein BCR38DRAFT_426080 [Pseudomassariella vexata]ORY67103.1 hypothetical protein BCR38DRAFT_426080 [Pseudomassariella vexata]